MRNQYSDLAISLFLCFLAAGLMIMDCSIYATSVLMGKFKPIEFLFLLFAMGCLLSSMERGLRGIAQSKEDRAANFFNAQTLMGWFGVFFTIAFLVWLV